MKKTVCGCVVIKFEKDDTKILLVSEDGIEWGLPKGGIEHGEDPESAAIRETLEETSISVRTIGFLGTAGRLSVWYALPMDREKTPIPQPGEIMKASYHSIDNLPSIDPRQMPLVSVAVERLRMTSRF